MKKRLLCLFISISFISGCSSQYQEKPKALPAYNTTAAISETELQTSAEAADLTAWINEIVVRDEDFIPAPTDIKSEETPEFGNLICNITNGNRDGLICPDTDNNCVYITALGYDNCLYKRTGDKMELVLDKTLWGMNLVGDKLYCIMNSDNPKFSSVGAGLGSGDIYYYNLSDGSLELLFKADAWQLAAVDGKLYYTSGTGRKARVFSYDLETGETVCCESGGLGFAGSRMLGFLEGTEYNCCLIDIKTGEISRFTAERLPNRLLADKDYIYYRSSGGGCIYRFDTKTGAETAVTPKTLSISYTDESGMLTEVRESTYIGGYAVINSEIFVVFKSAALLISSDGTEKNYYAESLRSA
ncbi:MAG: TolB family protein, partial [Ruminiclostridium sp.]